MATTVSTHSMALLQSKMSRPSSSSVRSEDSMSTQMTRPAAISSIFASSCCRFVGESPPANPNGTASSGVGQLAAEMPRPIDSSYRTDMLRDGSCSSRCHNGRVSELRCRINSTCGSCAKAARSFAAHSSAPPSLPNASTHAPLAEVALICTRPNPTSSCSLLTNATSPRSSSSTRVPHRCAARRITRRRLTAASLFSHSSDAYLGCPAFSVRKSTPHSTHSCCFEMACRSCGSTESSAPQKPRQRSEARGGICTTAGAVWPK
mmetsp:Transcript_919/g.1853  ORF Transcript_919/g.1853 Transcript_919/m.1853 type:complete len:263 (-) Transcript_919:290-1078(-)